MFVQNNFPCLKFEINFFTWIHRVSFVFYPSLIFEFIVPLILIAGFKTRIVASILFLFVLTVTLIFHTDFSNSMQIISFLKNTAIMGGLLIIISSQPQMCSIDYYLKQKKR